MKPLFDSPVGAYVRIVYPGGEFHNDRGDHAHGGVDLGCQRIVLRSGRRKGVCITAGRSTGLGGNKCEILYEINGDEHVLAHYHFGYKNQPWEDCIFVRPGQKVWKGSPLGIAGDSGNASAVHDHYEHRINGKRVDPLQYLREYQVARRRPLTPLRLALAYPKAEGPDVPFMQRRLTLHGHPVVADGIYGPKTVLAVEAFQACHGLKADGIVGALTWQQLVKRPAL